MKAQMRCTACGRLLVVPPQLAGKKVKCPGCGAVMAAPGPWDEVTEALAAPVPAAPVPAAPPPMPSLPPPPSAIPWGEPVVDRPAAPFRFPVTVKDDPQGRLNGRWWADLTREGLYLCRGSPPGLLIPVGESVDYPGGNRFVASIDGRPVEFAVGSLTLRGRRLARDLVDFLGGRIAQLEPAAYRVPWYLVLPVFLSLGVPLLALPAGIVAAVLGLTVPAICFAQARWQWVSAGWRAAASWGTLAFGYLVAFVLLAFAAVSWFQERTRPKWQDFNSPGGGFSARFPALPRESVETNAAQPGTRLHITQATLPFQDMGYYVHYADLPVAVPNEAVDFFYDQTRGGILSDFPGGQMSGEQRVSAGRFQGREYTIDMPRGVRVIRRVFVNGRRFYLVSVSGPRQRVQATDPDIRQFLDSFRIW